MFFLRVYIIYQLAAYRAGQKLQWQCFRLTYISTKRLHYIISSDMSRNHDSQYIDQRFRCLLNDVTVGLAEEIYNQIIIPFTHVSMQRLIYYSQQKCFDLVKSHTNAAYVVKGEFIISSLF